MKISPEERIWLTKLRESLVPRTGFVGRLLGKKPAEASELSTEAYLCGLELQGYRFGELLGLGSVGAVFEVERLEDAPELPLAVKAVNLSRETPAEEHAAFDRELEIGKKLSHPGIVKTIDSLQNDAARFLILERASGGTLSDRLGEPWEPTRLVSTFESVVAGLQYAHEQGVIHRDLKPDNIIFGESDTAKIVDFGLSHLRDSVELTLTGQFKGTISYAAPEQFQDTKRVTPACDQFAMGMLLFECLGGSLPFEDHPKNPMGAIMDRVTRPAALLSTVRPNTAEQLDSVLARMMAMMPDERYASVAEAFEALKETL
jgi:serine/threonine protein kinase